MVKRFVQNLLHKDLSYQIHGAAIEVRKDFGPGHKEKLYQSAFAEELKRRKIPLEKEKVIKVYSPKDGKYIGLYRPDFIVNGKIIVEIKAEKFVSRDEIRRIYDYLRNSEYELAYFINFASPRLFIKRIIYTNDFKPFNKPLKVINTKLINTKNLLVSIGLILVLFSGVRAANAASLYFSPSSGSYTVGQSFSISVYVSSADQAMNAASGAISFPRDKIEVISLSKTGSIFNLWVQEPLFSNNAGTINFEGIVLNPGFTGSAGKIITINFRAKSSGSASLSFSSGSVLANDGRGTNILTSMGSANYFLQTTGAAPPAQEETAPGVPLAHDVSSLTHPEPEKWYSNNDPEFIWKLPQDVTKVSYAIDQNPTTNPKFIADTLVDKVSFTDLKDGIWYFHINFKNQYGWGKLTHRKALIDTQPPESFKIIVEKEDLYDPRPILHFETTDALSGVEYYEVIIGGNKIDSITLADLKKSPYKLPVQTPDKYLVEVKAYDKAQNFTLSSTEIEILPIETPFITKYPKRLNVGEKVLLEGKSLPGITILVFIQEKGKEPEKQETKSDQEGNWAFVSEPLEKGSYEAWVQAKDKREALSLPSQKVSFEVGLPPLLKIGTIAISYLTIMSTLIVLFAVAIGVVFYVWYRINIWRKKMRAETKEVSQSVLSAFKALKEEVEEQIEFLDGKPGLNKNERRVRDKLKEALSVSEEFIGKEVRDIEKSLE